MGVLLFGALLRGTGDWRAAVLGGLCAMQLVWSLRGLRRLQQPVDVAQGRAWTSDRPMVFMGLSTCYRGSRSVRGLFIASNMGAAFVPVESWGPALVSAFVSAFGQRCEIVEVSLNPYDLDEATLQEATAPRGGFVLGDDWRWSAARQLVSPTDRWVLVVDDRPPAVLEDRWERVPAPTPKQAAERNRKVAQVGAAASLGCVGLGAVIAWWMGNLDPLIAGLGYGLLVLRAFGIAAFVLSRSERG